VAGDFSAFHSCSGTHQASCVMDSGGLFPHITKYLKQEAIT